MSEVTTEEIFNMLSGKRIDVLEQFREEGKDITDISERLEISEMQAESHYQNLEREGYLEKQAYEISSAELTDKGREALRLYHELRETAEEEIQEDEEVMEVKTVNRNTVVYENGHVWEGDPSSYSLEPGEYTRVKKTGKTSVGLGMEKVEVIEHIGK